MQKQTIPLLYKIILKKFWSDSIMGQIRISSARHLCSWYFRLGKENWNNLYFDMIERGYLESHGRKGGLKILVQLKDLV